MLDNDNPTGSNESAAQPAPADAPAGPESTESTTSDTPAGETAPAKKAAATKAAKKAPAKKAAAKKAPAKKTAAKKTAAAADAADAPLVVEAPLDAPVDTSAPEAAPAEDAAAGDTAPAKKAARKAPAKKAAAKKAPAKKAAAKKTAAKKTTAAPEGDPQLPLDASAPAAARDAATPELTEEELEAQAAEAALAEAAEASAATATALLFQPPAAAKTPARRTRKTAAQRAAEAAETAAATDGAEGTDAAAQAPTAEGSESSDETAEKPAPRKRTRKTAAQRAAEAAEDAPAGDADQGDSGADQDDTDSADQDDTDNDAADQGDEQGGNRRRRRRGGRRRRKSGGNGGDDNDSADDESGDANDAGEAEQKPARSGGDQGRQNGQNGPDDKDDRNGDDSGTSGSSRRRRRRRRAGEEGDGGGDDPANTVTRVRKARTAEDEITALHGSTRLEAKKQRRREGREAGRRRAPIVSEAEFLARREAVDRVMVIRQRKDLTQIAVLEDKVLVEHYVARESQTSLIGNVYLGRVQNVLPSMEAAFIDIGKGRNAVLYAGEVNWDALGAGNGPRKIEAVLKSGQSVLVQVTKDPIGHKGARLTSQISLPGRFLVYVPDGTTSGISRKLPDTERNRLKTLLKEIVPDSAGVIVRTAAEGASEEELTRDVERLTARWEDIASKVEKGNAPALLYGEPDLTLKVVRDLFTEDFGKLVVSGEDAWDMVEQYVDQVAPDLAERLERHDDSEDVFATFRIDEQIDKALDRKVWLPSGGSLIIDRTEAMTVVDVNTGKFTGSGGNLEETVTKNNLEAAEEIVRQLRLRDIGGIIVVDFIDMVLESNRDLVLRRLVECLGRDRTRHQVAEVTSLGLVQMTRKRIGTGLLEAFTESCEHCGGRGLITHHEPVDPKKKQDDEPRRSRRGRNRGQDDQEPAAHASAPSPKDVAAMARHEEEAAGQRDEQKQSAEAPAPEPAPDSSPESAQESAQEPAAQDTREDAGQDESRSGRSRSRRSRGGRGGRDRDDAATPDPQAGDSTDDTETPDRGQGAAVEVAPAVAAEAPAAPAVEPVAQPEQPVSPPQPAVRTTVRTRGRATRAAGPTNAAAEQAAVMTVTPSAAQAATEREPVAAAAETAAPRVVTSTRRVSARRPAGPPAGPPAGAVRTDSAHADATADGTGEGHAEGPADGTEHHEAAHVPVKKKGSRKR